MPWTDQQRLQHCHAIAAKEAVRGREVLSEEWSHDDYSGGWVCDGCARAYDKRMLCTVNTTDGHLHSDHDSYQRGGDAIAGADLA